MTLLDSNTRPLLVDDVANLLVLPSLNQSIAADPVVTTRITTTSATLRMPVQTADPTAAWVAEGQEIAVSDAALTEVDITPAKLAALSVISSELANDSSPAAARVVGQGMARDLAKRIDAAFFGSLPSPAPSGLGALSGVHCPRLHCNPRIRREPHRGRNQAMTKRQTAGDRMVVNLTAALSPGLEWSEAEQVTLELLRKQVGTVATLEALMDAEVGSDNARPRLVAELAAELRLSRQAVAKYVAALPTDETPVKSERHQRAAQARWGVRGVAI